MSHENRYPRRTFLAGAALGVVGGGAVGWLGQQYRGAVKSPHAESPRPAATAPTAVAMPGPFPGRVIEVHHPGAVKSGQKNKGYTERNRAAVKAMIDRGMKELVGSEDAVQAWRHFFAPGDRVGIKVVPVGKPDSISSYEV